MTTVMRIAGGGLLLLWILWPTRYDLVILLALALVGLLRIRNGEQK